MSMVQLVCVRVYVYVRVHMCMYILHAYMSSAPSQLLLCLRAHRCRHQFRVDVFKCHISSGTICLRAPYTFKCESPLRAFFSGVQERVIGPVWISLFRNLFVFSSRVWQCWEPASVLRRLMTHITQWAGDITLHALSLSLCFTPGIVPV